MGTTNLRNGSSGEDVTQLQDGLRRLGYQVDVDGRFGPRTEDAVKSLQMLFGYTVDGIAGEGTQQLVQQQLGYGWNLNLPNAKELAMNAQNGGGQAMGKGGAPQLQGGQQGGGKPMQGDGQQQYAQQGKPMQGGQPQPMQGKPMAQQGYGKDMGGGGGGKDMGGGRGNNGNVKK